MPTKVEFDGAMGDRLAARLDEPEGRARAWALFAHCFTCSKDIAAASRIAGDLAERGIGVLRFDFTGLGHSDGEFEHTTFTSNVGDLVAAADWLASERTAPAIVVGHSLGGAAVLAAAGSIDAARAVATIGAPADPEHVLHLLGPQASVIEAEGRAEVSIGGRPFTVGRALIDDLRAQDPARAIGTLGAALMVMHSPVDDVVGIENASRIFGWARHPRSFLSLDDADHLLRRRRDADYVAEVLAAWASRYVDD